jgi:dihydroxyacid dehydratase/phosphogluconate dehydratase
MGSPEGEKGLFTGAIRTGDTIQIDLDRVLG